jgi:hypothetical protein
MYSTYDQSRTYDMPKDSRVIYGKSIRVQVVEMLMDYGTNKKR